LTRRMVEEGRLPNLARMAERGHFAPLETSIPPQSPVAWSDFITGLDAGGHGIFDFLHRDPATMVPYLSTSTTEPPGRTLTVGRWQIPLGGGQVVLMRQGTPFWEPLQERGIANTIVRIPANFPPSGTAGRELSGMGTPDILGGYGTYSFFTTAPERLGGSPAGDVQRAEIRRDVFTGSLRGPPNPLLVEPEDLRSDFTVYIDPVRPVVSIEIGDEELILAEGDWSEWVPVEYALPLFQSLRGMTRFYLKQVWPELQLYATPVNIDPLDAAMPVSSPDDFAAELAEGGRFYTQGFPEDTDAISDGVFTYDEYLAQAALAAGEIRRQYERLLADFEDGLLFNYFGFLDQVSHIMWRAMDPEHPAYDEGRDGPYAHVIEELYVEADEIVGETLARLEELGGGGTLVVMSDHGFTSWRRSFSVNTWLEQKGYLAVRDRNRRDLDFLQNVDWERTQAYALGLSGLYVNLEGREATGIVPPSERTALLEEISRGLLREIDPATGEPAITRVYPRDGTYTDVGHADIGPDLVIGFAKGVRSSDASAAGAVPAEVLTDNTGAWSGDHIMDHEAVPGVLVTNRPLRLTAGSLRELAAAVLAELGVEGFPVRSAGGGLR
ncbi:MAG TPA: alkaline phosphatase family protein, partial [Longimicrobiales bacterium]|nr:alkaline phosphatase family protein [Longimicrobiales bacterium]